MFENLAQTLHRSGAPSRPKLLPVTLGGSMPSGSHNSSPSCAKTRIFRNRTINQQLSKFGARG